MTVYDIVSICCFALLSAYAVYIAVHIVSGTHARRVAFLRSFKKGKCALIYVIGIPLYCIGQLFDGLDFFKAFFVSVNKVLSTVVLKYEISCIENLLNANRIYRVTVYFCFALIGLNALLFTFSLIDQYVWNRFRSARFRLSKKDKLVLIGSNDGNVDIYKSAGRFERVLIDDISNKEAESFYSEKIHYLSFSSDDALALKAFSVIEKNQKSKLCFVINTSDDDRNIQLCLRFIKMIGAKNGLSKKHFYSAMQIFVYGAPRYEAIYEDLMSNSCGIIQYVNKYRQIAMDFVNRYPLTAFMNREQIDYNTSLIRPGVDINVFLIGFGSTNRQIFLTSVANNQFMTMCDGKRVLKPVNYIIYDKDCAENNQNLNHTYYRFRDEVPQEKQSEYLPFPELPAKETYCRLDINDSSFYRCIRNAIEKNPNGVNFVVIAFGADLENIDMARKLIEKRREWGIERLVIFVKVRARRKERLPFEEDDCYFIANEKDVVYNINGILGDGIFKMAKLRNMIYDLEYEITENAKTDADEQFIADCRERSEDKWYLRKSQLERESSLYCCLSIRSKLNLMGLDYCKKSEGGDALTEEEYLTVYAQEDRPDFTHYKATADGKRIAYYPLDYQESRRKTMAVQEHYRWNSFMLSKGIVPATTEQIRSETTASADGKIKYTNGKNYRLRRHGNVTTFDGLVAFRKIVAERDHEPEIKKDVIKYDYQILDDAFWLLDSFDFKIIKKRDAL